MSSGFDAVTSQEIMYRSRLNCEAGLDGCQGRGRHLHHRKLRRHGDHTAVNGLHVCVKCHHQIHKHPARSYEAGLLVHSWDDPAAIPLTTGDDKSKVQGL